MSSAGVLYAGRAFDGQSDMGEQARNLAEDFLAEVRASGAAVSTSTVGRLWVVVTELLANATRHAAGPCVLELQLRGGQVEVSVWDTVPTLIESVDADGTTGSEGGLGLVRELCSHFHMQSSAGGKRIQARIPLVV
ncbi:ATP-binding protein [Streptomyces mesophilus]|uniref:ATP-binding protein n=1 Tax=Streptomyces mesophilus TaxID=1775132 RepID=UPI0033198C11